jgi:hypothetical protein
LRAERLVRGNAAWGRVGNEIAPLDPDARTLDTTLRNAVKHSERWLALPPVEREKPRPENCRADNRCGRLNVSYWR